MKIFLIVLAVLIVFFIAPTMVMSYFIYSVILVRTSKEKWGRGCSAPEDEELCRIYADGEAWASTRADKKTDVSVQSDGLTLWGEYFDLGSDRAVIVIPGRMEACRYSYHFARPYAEGGYNVLVIDNRCHGLSDGKYHALGYKEYRDIHAWSRMLHERFGNRLVYLHGVCIGSSVALFALTSPDCPDYLCGMTADGMYTTFYESFKNHMIEQKRPLFPFLYEVMLWIRLISGADAVTDGPVKRIRRLTKPILFLHSREDVFSLPEKAETLYRLCPSEKKIVWFDHGAHSRIRVNAPDAYDRAILDFLRERSLLPQTPVVTSK